MQARSDPEWLQEITSRIFARNFVQQEAIAGNLSEQTEADAFKFSELSYSFLLLQQKVETLRKENQEISNELRDYTTGQKSSTILQETIEQLEESLFVEQEQAKLNKQSLADMQELNRSLVKQLAQLHEKNDDATKQIDNLTRENHRLQQEKMNLENTITVLTEESRTKQIIIDKQMKQIDAIINPSVISQPDPSPIKEFSSRSRSPPFSAPVHSQKGVSTSTLTSVFKTPFTSTPMSSQPVAVSQSVTVSQSLLPNEQPRFLKIPTTKNKVFELPTTATKISFNQKGTKFALACTDKTVRIYSTDKCSLLSTLTDLETDPASIALTTRSTYLAAGQASGTISIFSLGLSRRESTLNTHTKPVNSLAYCGHGNETRLLSGGADRKVVVWDVPKACPLMNMQYYSPSMCYGVCVEVNGHVAYSGHKDGVVRCWDLKSGQVAEEMRAKSHTSPISGLCLSDDNRTLIVVTDDGNVTLFDTAQRKEQKTTKIPGFSSTLQTLQPCLSPQLSIPPFCSFLLTTGKTGTMFITSLDDLKTQTIQASSDSHGRAPLTCAGWSRDADLHPSYCNWQHLPSENDSNNQHSPILFYSNKDIVSYGGPEDPPGSLSVFTKKDEGMNYQTVMHKLSGIRFQRPILTNHRRFIFGASNPRFETNNFYEIDRDVTKCSVVRSAKDNPPVSSGFSICDSKNTILIFGGYTPTADVVGDLHSFDLTTQKWTHIKPNNKTYESNLPPPMHGHTATCIGDEMFVFGGSVTKPPHFPNAPRPICLNNLYSFNLITNTWRLIRSINPEMSPPLNFVPSPRCGHIAITHANKMYVLGGEYPRRLNDLWEFDPTTNLWTIVPVVGKIPFPVGPDAFVKRKKVLFILGKSLSGPTLRKNSGNTLFSLNLSNRTCSLCLSPSSCRLTVDPSFIKYVEPTSTDERETQSEPQIETDMCVGAELLALRKQQFKAKDNLHLNLPTTRLAYFIDKHIFSRTTSLFLSTVSYHLHSNQNLPFFMLSIFPHPSPDHHFLRICAPPNHWFTTMQLCYTTPPQAKGKRPPPPPSKPNLEAVTMRRVTIVQPESGIDDPKNEKPAQNEKELTVKTSIMHSKEEIDVLIDRLWFPKRSNTNTSRKSALLPSPFTTTLKMNVQSITTNRLPVYDPRHAVPVTIPDDEIVSASNDLPALSLISDVGTSDAYLIMQWGYYPVYVCVHKWAFNSKFFITNQLLVDRQNLENFEKLMIEWNVKKEIHHSARMRKKPCPLSLLAISPFSESIKLPVFLYEEIQFRLREIWPLVKTVREIADGLDQMLMHWTDARKKQQNLKISNCHTLQLLVAWFYTHSFVCLTDQPLNERMLIEQMEKYVFLLNDNEREWMNPSEEGSWEAWRKTVQTEAEKRKQAQKMPNMIESFFNITSYVCAKEMIDSLAVLAKPTSDDTAASQSTPTESPPLLKRCRVMIEDAQAMKLKQAMQNYKNPEFRKQLAVSTIELIGISEILNSIDMTSFSQNLLAVFGDSLSLEEMETQAKANGATCVLEEIKRVMFHRKVTELSRQEAQSEDD
ncbi:hypothetical protein BLNAU_13229 [Blattamonas nauphoetae]|uniref:Guanine nucleotide-binding protein subunit beta-like protein n=1 Tax=Blattamonas nauphoetae TaxID=2049346 RepID=A0ABQ9XJE9_9EUKA|nr:hypothetical protein BLNAU_13229 [Blattamonas nauphoetae]